MFRSRESMWRIVKAVRRFEMSMATWSLRCLFRTPSLACSAGQRSQGARGEGDFALNVEEDAIPKPRPAREGDSSADQSSGRPGALSSIPLFSE